MHEKNSLLIIMYKESKKHHEQSSKTPVPCDQFAGTRQSHPENDPNSGKSLVPAVVIHLKNLNFGDFGGFLKYTNKVELLFSYV